MPDGKKKHICPNAWCQKVFFRPGKLKRHLEVCSQLRARCRHIGFGIHSDIQMMMTMVMVMMMMMMMMVVVVVVVMMNH